jgi:Na+/H+ antiporter NhaA
MQSRAHREGHPAVDYLLLLASLDDGFGILIMSVFYRARPQKLEWLTLLLLAMLLVCTRAHTLHTRTYAHTRTYT